MVLFSFLFSLLSTMIWRLFQIKDKREERKVDVSPYGDVFKTAGFACLPLSRLMEGGLNMPTPLSEMTLEELWALFPITLTSHNPDWQAWYSEMSAILRSALSSRGIIRISHIGSTAVNGIWAKPIIDILVEISPDEDISVVSELIAKGGFIKMAESESRISFNRGYTENGFAEKVYPLHLRFAGDNDELYFRDYLNDNPHIAKEYERLKLSLWHQFEHDRDGYTQAKTVFVIKHTLSARELYKNRYV